MAQTNATLQTKNKKKIIKKSSSISDQFVFHQVFPSTGCFPVIRKESLHGDCISSTFYG
jgi:isocitrate dehydrogenase